MIAPKPNVEAHASERTRQKSNFAKSNLIRIGYFLLGVSFSFYLLTEYFPTEKRQDLFTLFIVHYLVAFVYAALLITTGDYGIRKSWKKENLDKTVILLNLFLISAYALNRQLPVFAESTTWLCVYL